MLMNRGAVCLACLASLVALTAQADDVYTNRKRAELFQETYLPDNQFSSRDVRQSKFWSGSRYGRSGHGGSQPRLEVEPRGDRFFMGSRYGKRSDVGADQSTVTRGLARLLAAAGVDDIDLFLCSKCNREVPGAEQPDGDESQ